MKITESQLELLRSLKCERLSSKPENFSLIDDFYNTRNNSLVDTLQGDAYDDDENNRIAYYIVKTVDDKILFFFSLKCGLLYDEFIEGDRLKEIKSFYDTIFGYFIVPKILEMLKIVGCEYVFLFAADLTPYEELIRYYSDQLKFEKADEHCVAIPMYDFTCQFMSQKTCELEGKREQFSEEFNN